MKYFYFFSILLIVFITACDSNNSGKSSRDGKIDKTVTIGGQTWMAENLNVDKFRNGDLIPEAKTNSEYKKCDNSANFSHLGECKTPPFLTYTRTFTNNFDNCV